jgi:hypothetical protein
VEQGFGSQKSAGSVADFHAHYDQKKGERDCISHYYRHGPQAHAVNQPEQYAGGKGEQHGPGRSSQRLLRHACSTCGTNDIVVNVPAMKPRNVVKGI